MPNWKKVIVSGSDALLNSLTTTGSITSITGGITGSDVTIDDWGSISASLASIEASGTQNFQQVTDQGNTTTNQIIASSFASNTEYRIDTIGGTNGFKFRSGSTDLGGQGTFYHDRLRFTIGENNVHSSYIEFDASSPTTGSFKLEHQQATGEGGKFVLRHTPSNPNSWIPTDDYFAVDWDDVSGRITHPLSVGLLTNSSSLDLSTDDGTLYLSGITSISSSHYEGFDVFIKDWGSVSASLASINSTASSVTLQEVLNASNGEATASGSIYLTSSAASLDFEYTVLHAGTVVAEGGSGLFSTPNTSSPSSHFTTALTMGSPHSASVASSLKSNTGFSTDYRGQRRQLFPSDYVSAASQSMYVEYAEGANQNDNGTAYFQVNLDTNSPEYLLPLTASRLYVRAGESSSPPPLTVEENIVISSSGTHGGTLSFSDLTHMASDKNTINSGGSTAIQVYSLASFIGVKLDYVVYLGARDGGSNITHRAGTFMATWDESGNISYSETTTTDNQSGVGIPSTSGFSIFAEVGVGSTAQISVENTTGYTATLISQTTAFRAPY